MDGQGNDTRATATMHKPAFLTDRRLLFNWFIAQQRLTSLKQSEKRWREAVQARFFPSPNVGVNHVMVTASAKLTLTQPETYTLDKDHDAITAAVDKIAAIDGEEIATALVSWKPSLDAATYKALSNSARQIIDSVLDIKHGTAAIKLTDPKKEF